jgi:hypothetical protein
MKLGYISKLFSLPICDTEVAEGSNGYEIIQYVLRNLEHYKI